VLQQLEVYLALPDPIDLRAWVDAELAELARREDR
jgi:hypothetical protein